MLILNAAAVRQALPMPIAIQAMKEAFAALSGGRSVVPQRAHLPVKPHAGITLVMSAFVDGESVERQALAVKVVSLFDGNRDRGLARIQAAVTAFEPDTGRPIALLEGATLTALRTAAASGVATDLLARRDSRTLAVFGAGVQARAHVLAILAVRPLERVLIHSRTPASVERMIGELTQHADVRVPLLAVDSSAAALREADIVCATTTSREPIFDDADVRPGTHVNAVGSFTPHVREIPPETVRRARVFVDSRDAAWEEAGDLIQPWVAGLIGRDHIQAELGELLTGARPGRLADTDITLFKSVGIAVQDAVAARFALENARRMGIGEEVEW